MHGSASHSVPISGWEYTEVKAASNHVSVKMSANCVTPVTVLHVEIEARRQDSWPKRQTNNVNRNQQERIKRL